MSDEYFGRTLADGRNQIGASAIQQDLADEWMSRWGRVGRQALQLMQQFGPDEIYFRVIGTDKAQPLKASREDIRASSTWASASTCRCSTRNT